MPKVEMYRWRVPQEPPRKPYLTRYYLTLEDGRARFPNGEPALEWKEVREVIEPGQAAPSGATSSPMPGSAAWRRGER